MASVESENDWSCAAYAVGVSMCEAQELLESASWGPHATNFSHYIGALQNTKRRSTKSIGVQAGFDFVFVL